MLLYLTAGLVAFVVLFTAAGIATERVLHYGAMFFRRGSTRRHVNMREARTRDALFWSARSN